MITVGYLIIVEFSFFRYLDGFDWSISLLTLITWFYFAVCGILGFVVFPIITAMRLSTVAPNCVRSEKTQCINLWDQCGSSLIGDGFWRHCVKLPFNRPFTVEFTDLALKAERSPQALDGLSILFLSDFHFFGSPSQAYFEAILKEIESQPTPDIVALGGDFVDSMEHHAWLAPLLGRLKWKEAGLAILGNHDHKYEPDKIRETLASLDFNVLSNTWKELAIRGERCVVVGHEGPWNRPGSALSGLPKDVFKLGISHTPDNFNWAVRERIDLVLCGHTHGGQVRLPIIGSIFVPSIYGRKYDQGVFMQHRTAMIVGRGISGKEPLRVNCPPQVLRITLTSS
jgi:hypothetical protein